MKHRKLLIRIGYITFAGLMLVISGYLTYPAEAVGQRLSHELSRATGGKYTATFGEIAPYRFTGIEADDVTLRSVSMDGEGTEISLDRVRVRLALLPLVLLKLGATAAVDLGDGAVQAAVTAGDSDGSFDIELEIDELNFAVPPVLPKLMGFPLGGKLGGKVQLSWARDLRKAEGQASLTIENASLGPGQIQGFTLPHTSLGQLDFALDIKAGRMRLVSFKQQGGDIRVKASLTSSLRPSFPASSLDACLELKPTEGFLNTNPKFKTVMELAQVKFRKDNEGFLHVSLGGSFAKPRQRRGLCSKGGRK